MQIFIYCKVTLHVSGVQLLPSNVADQATLEGSSCTSWLEDWDFARDGVHINRRGARRLGQLYSRVSGLGDRGKKVD